MMNTIADRINAKDCTGCSACMSVCPRSAISMQMDGEGFIVPVINISQCVDCGECVEHCQVSNPPLLQKHKDSYIAQYLNHSAKKSASGGAFRAMANWVIHEKGGVVFGAAYCIDKRVRHIAVESIDELQSLQGSKYVQSDIDGSYDKIKHFLETGRNVLFSGTPCQVAGLKCFLKNDYPNLYTVDIICHGVPSPYWLVYYLTAREKEFDDKILNMRNRVKSPIFQSGSAFYMMIKMGKRNVFIQSSEDPYMNSFLKGVAFRESCYRCPYAQRQRVGDITIGDCDSHQHYPLFHPNQSNSTIIINTERGKGLWGNIKKSFDFSHLDFDLEVSCNKQLHQPSLRPEIRNNFYSKVLKMNIDEMYTAGLASRPSRISNIKILVALYMPWLIRLKSMLIR